MNLNKAGILTLSAPLLAGWLLFLLYMAGMAPWLNAMKEVVPPLYVIIGVVALQVLAVPLIMGLSHDFERQSAWRKFSDIYAVLAVATVVVAVVLAFLI